MNLASEGGGGDCSRMKVWVSPGRWEGRENEPSGLKNYGGRGENEPSDLKTMETEEEE